MTDNIQKLYEIAGVEKLVEQAYHVSIYGTIEGCLDAVERWEKETGLKAKNITVVSDEAVYFDKVYHPPFTAEKQLELIKKVLEKGLLQLNRSSLGNIQFCNFGNAGDYKADFDEALASFIINLWQDLSDNQKQEIKRILQ